MTLEEKYVELRKTVADCEAVNKKARRRLRQAELEIEAAARARITSGDNLETAKKRLVNFKNYYIPGN